MIRTGVDWSGDPGDPRYNPADSGWLVMVGCHLADENAAAFVAQLVRLKQDLGLREDHAFKHLKSISDTRQRYFEMLATTDLRVTASYIDKRSWPDEYFRRCKGPRRIVDSLVELVQVMDETDVSGQVLMIDAQRAEKRFLSDLRRDLRHALRSEGKKSFKKVVPKPDDRSDGFLIQAADMIAGDLRRHGAADSVAERCIGTNILTIIQA